MRTPDELALIASIADDLPCGVWVSTAPEGRFVYSNRAFEEIMGMGPVSDAKAGEYAAPYGIFHREGRPYPEDRLPFVRALQERATVMVDDIVIHRRDGRRVYVRAFGKPMFDAAGAIAHVAVVFFDVTREVEAQEAQHRMQVQLAHAERLASVGVLAAAVAHEVNNPLSFVLGSLDVMAREVVGAHEAPAADRLRALEGLLQDARQGAERVRSIVRDLKVFSRVEEQRPAAVDVRGPLQAALQMASNEIRHRARVVCDLQPVPPVWCDEARVGQLFLNLLVNAAQAIPEGAAETNEIRVVTRREAGDLVCVEVSDSGAGIPADLLPRIFEPFSVTKPTSVATGLALSVCHAIATEIGGRIEAENRPGEGATFRVLLPFAPQAAEPRSVAAKTPPPRRARVLVVDDEPLILKVVAQMLGREHDVTCESSGRAALERIRRGERYDAIMCDLMMPQVTGMDLYDAVLEIAPKQAQSMLFLTGGAFTARARAFLDRVPDSMIEKPFDAATLLARVRRILG